MSDTNCYDPRRSNFNPDALAAFIRAPIKKELLSVPGIGPKNKESFQNNGIFTVHQLMGKFLSLSEEETDCVELCDKFYFWMQLIGVNSHRGAIVSALGEKLAIIVPDIYDSEIYEIDNNKDIAIELESNGFETDKTENDTGSENESENEIIDEPIEVENEIMDEPIEGEFETSKSRGILRFIW